MATITSLTAQRILNIEAATVVDGSVVGSNLILTRNNGETINAGVVRGADGVGRPPFITTVPSSAADGDEIYYQNAAMAAAGIVWHLRYREDSPNGEKWEFLGGAPLFTQTVLGFPVSLNSWQTFGNTLTIPTHGLYSLSWFANLAAPSLLATTMVSTGVYFDGVRDSNYLSRIIMPQTVDNATIHSGDLHKDCDAGTVIQLGGVSSSSGVSALGRTQLQIKPIRLMAA